MLDWQAMGIIILMLAKNVAYSIIKEKAIYGLIKVLSNMYKKPLVSNKVFLIRQLANTKMQEGTSVIYHVKEFNFLLSKLVLVDIKFHNEVQALLTLSSLFCNWSSMWDYKIDFQRIRDLILS